MEIAIELLNEKMQEISAEIERSHSKQFASAVRHIMKSFSSVEKAAINIGKATRRAWGSITRSAEQHGIRLSEQVLEACGSLAGRTPGMSYGELKEFEEESLHVARSIVRAYNKYVVSIMRSVKSETSILERSIADLSKSISELSGALNVSDLGELQLLTRDAEKLVQNASELHLKMDQIREWNERLREAQGAEVRLQNDLSLLSEDETLKELSRIEKQIKQKEAEILALFDSLSKPLRKLDRPESISALGSQKATVSKLAEDPVTATLETPAAEMRDLLGLLRRLIEHDELLLDRRRKRRSIEAIQTLEAGALDKFREDYSILQANRSELLRQLKGSGIYERWMSMRNQLDDAKAEASNCQSRIMDLQSRETRLRALILADKGKMETTLQELLKERVSIIV